MNTSNIMTVTGEIPGSMLQVTLAHEHLYCDISLQSGKADNKVMDVPLVTAELAYFRTAGGSSIIETTPEGIGRNSSKLRTISEHSGVNIIGGIAFYDQSTYPEWVHTATVSEISDYLIREIEEGTEGVCAGLIGELMSHNQPEPDPIGYRLHEVEHRIFAAAASAQRRTRVAISTHAALGRGGLAQLDVLERAGADLSRVAIGHCDAHWHKTPDTDLSYYLSILNRGAYCQFDMIGWTQLVPDEIRADRIATLVQLGFADKITLSTDTCRLSQLHANNGRGFDYLYHYFLPLLQQRGVNALQTHSMLVDAPRNLLAGI